MGSPDNTQPALPAGPPSDAERQAVVDRVQQALAADQIAFEDLDDRFALIYRATTRTELAAAVADLPSPAAPPPPPPTARHPAPSRRFALIGDTEIGGWLTFAETTTVTAGIGDTTIDLSSAHIVDGVTITAQRLIGDVEVIVPDGARVQVDDITLIGDRREVLTPPSPFGPLIRIRALGLIGDVHVYSLSQVPDGPLRRFWTRLRAGRHPGGGR